ncbi:MAG: 4-alpha-glucanotransferase [Spirochaetales bacterium]|nr:4-alpha-glucanotransferase [Spirochaetales bacterium]
MKRKSGVLLHPTSLPGPWGIGEIGSGCMQFLDFMKDAGQTLWQILPLGPTGYGNSPYSAVSSFAGNPLLICVGDLAAWGYLSREELPPEHVTRPSTDWIDYETLSEWKLPLLVSAARRFLEDAEAVRKLESFIEDHPWVRDYGLFMALRGHFNAQAAAEKAPNSRWNVYWPRDIADRNESALSKWRDALAPETAVHQVLQYFFHEQWQTVKAAAAERHIQIIGDIPIFVAEDSSDVWANSGIFHLDKNRQPKVVAGVPPDYFSAKGQRWGNPLYNWDELEKSGYRWWLDRISRLLEQVDILRIDHFKGFESYWEIPQAEETALGGRWVKGPGDSFFHAVRRRFPGVEILAEDLGLITPEVHALRDRHNLPGMNVLQFAFEYTQDGRFNSSNTFLPHNHTPRSVAYTGTHDNDTTAGWYGTLESNKKDLVRRYLGRSDGEVVWGLLRAVQMSAAQYAIAPLQDYLTLPSEARMNTPGTVGPHNWSWRVRQEALNGQVAATIRELGSLYGRTPRD